MSELEGQTLGQYELMEVIGKGGAAIVYLARQVSIDRLVAVKVLSPRAASAEDGDDFEARFVREAKLIARLEHDRIVPIYDFGEENGHYFFVIRLMDNSLNRLLHSGPLSVEMANHYLQQVCRALQYAHDKDVIHRDIKPSNILLSKDGGAYLSDFGLAKLLGGTNITEQGSVLGTPSYMAPEMWQEEEATVATDLYALGVTFFEMLHGAPPFQRLTSAGVMYDHLEKLPPPLVGVVPGISKEMEVAVHRLLAKDPAARYSSAMETAEAIDRAALTCVNQTRLSTRPAQVAHVAQDDIETPEETPEPLPTPELLPAVEPASESLPQRFQDESASFTPRLQRLKRRGGIVVGAAIGIVAVLVLVVLLFADERHGSTQPRAAAVEISKTATQAAATPGLTAPAPVTPALTAVAFSGTKAPKVAAGSELPAAAGPLENLAWSPDGQHLAGIDANGNLVIWQPGESAGRVWPTSKEGIRSFAWNPARPDEMVSVGADNRLRVWEIRQTARLLETVEGSTDEIQTITWSQDGSIVVGSGPTGRIFEWFVTHDWTQGGPQLTTSVTALDWSPDGTQYVSGSNDGGIRAWSSAEGTGKVVGSHTGGIVSLDWSPSGPLVAAVSADGSVRLWNVTNGSSVSLVWNLLSPVAVHFSPDGTRVAAAGSGQVHVWDTASGVLITTFSARQGINLTGIAWNVDGGTLAAATDQGTLLFWSIPAAAPARMIQGLALAAHNGAVNQLAWSPEHNWLASAGADSMLVVWDVATGKQMSRFSSGVRRGVTAIAWSPDANRVAAGGCDGAIVVWDMGKTQPSGRLAASQSCVTGVLFSADGSLLLGSDSTGAAGAWSTSTYEPVAQDATLHLASIKALTATSDRGIFASADENGLFRIWQLAGNKFNVLETWQFSSSPLTAIDWGPDKTSVITADQNGIIVIWDSPLASNSSSEFGQHQAAVSAVARNYTGQYLASADVNGCLVLWNLARREKLFQRCEQSGLAYRTLKWSPTSDLLAVGTDDGAIVFWRVVE